MQRGQFFIIKQEKYYTACDVEYAIGQHNYLTTSVENRLNLDVLSRDIILILSNTERNNFPGWKALCILLSDTETNE
ncbi:hypothetical protein A3Q34_02540 [Colwellia sp. PAMC 20917]|nr:hypothetical protein A3Q34_02540 [Colwellia sp. PAMC 20917]